MSIRSPHPIHASQNSQLEQPGVICNSCYRLAALLLGLTILQLCLLAKLACAAQINEDLIKGNTATYTQLLKELQAAKTQNEDTLLQETLVKKLITLSQGQKLARINISSPRDLKAYKALFQQYIQWSRDKAEIKEQINETRKKLYILKRQILSTSQGAEGLLTLQLQYAFYQKELPRFKAHLSILKEAMEKTPEVLAGALHDLTFNLKQINQGLAQTDKALDKIDSNIQLLKLKKERLSLLGRTSDIDRLNKSIQDLKNKRQALLEKKLVLLFLRFSYLLQKKDKEVFEVGKKLLELSRQLQGGKELERDLGLLIKKMDKKVMGVATTLHQLTLQRVKGFFHDFFQAIKAPIFYISDTPVSPLKLLISLVITILGFLAGNFYKSNVKKLPLNRTLTPATRTLLANLGYYAIIALSFFVGLNVVGLDLSSFALVAGALSVGIGFGLQNIVSNFISGIILMFERSIKIGDYIEFDSELRGRVRDIRMRSMTINTNKNIDVIVPNQDFIQNRVINWTMRDDIRRFDIPFSVAYGTDPQRVISIVMNAVTESHFQNIVNTSQRQTQVIMTGMGDSSVDYRLLVWIKGPDILRPSRTKSRFLILIYNALYESGIEIPFPQRDLHIRSLPKEIPFIIRQKDDSSTEDESY